MHIVLIAWLYVTLTMALTMDSIAGGVALFALLGLAPVAIAGWFAARRLRARRERSRAAESRDPRPRRADVRRSAERGDPMRR